MDAIKKAVRDPIWQFIGAVVAIIALVVSLPKSDEPGEFRISRAYSSSLKFLGATASEGSISFLVAGQEIDGSRITVHYFLVENRGAKPILGTAFHGGLLVRPQQQGDQLLSVKEICTAICDIAPLKWTTAENKTYAAVPSVINPKENIWMAVYVLSSKAPAKAKDAAPLWSARITNFNVTYYPDEIPPEPSLGEVQIHLQGWAIYFLLLLAVLLFIAGIAVARFSRLVVLPSAKSIVLLTGLAVMSFSSAEVGAHLAAADERLALVGWIAIAAHLLFLLVLAAIGIRRRKIAKTSSA